MPTCTECSVSRCAGQPAVLAVHGRRAERERRKQRFENLSAGYKKNGISEKAEADRRICIILGKVVSEILIQGIKVLREK